MNREEIDKLIGALQKELFDELATIQEVAKIEGNVERMKRTLLKGKISGKNADIRKQQEREILEISPAYQKVRRDLQAANNEAAVKKILRTCVETRISLIKAWLYSQQGSWQAYDKQQADLYKDQRDTEQDALGTLF